MVSSEYSIDIKVDELTLGFLVPKFEEHSVRQRLNYSIDQWRSLTREQRANEIAISRINQKIEYVKLLKSLGKI